MRLFRTLAADTPAELLAAQIATSAHPADAQPTPMEATPSNSTIFATLAILADNPGVLDANTPGLPAPASHQEMP